jgi:hypothetical protein
MTRLPVTATTRSVTLTGWLTSSRAIQGRGAVATRAVEVRRVGAVISR